MSPRDLLKQKNLKLRTGQVHVWSVGVSNSINQLKELSKLLSDDEKLRAAKYRFRKDKEVYTSARGLLRLLSAKYLETEPTAIEFQYSTYGKPSYLKKTSLNFNVSHSGNYIVIAFSQGLELGVDIEKIKNDFDVMELAGNFFSQEEINALSKIDEKDRCRAFYRCWTRKESFIKAVGQGLSYPLDSFAVSLSDDHTAEFLKIDEPPGHKDSWQLHSFVPAEGYIAALSAKGKPKGIKFLDWHRDVQP